jgi:hypothetical protein
MNTYRAYIVGGLWWPIGHPASVERDFWADDDAAAIERAQTTEAGDFSSLVDVQVWRTRYGHLFQLVKDWDNEDNALAYSDTLPEDE